MAICYMCEKNQRVSWNDYFCSDCKEIRAIAEVYGWDRITTIVKKCCVRSEEQLENKIKKQGVTTRSQSSASL